MSIPLSRVSLLIPQTQAESGAHSRNFSRFPEAASIYLFKYTASKHADSAWVRIIERGLMRNRIRSRTCLARPNSLARPGAEKKDRKNKTFPVELCFEQEQQP